MKNTKNELKFKGVYTLKHYRNGDLLQEVTYDNGVVNVGLTSILDINFRDAATKNTGWALGLIDDPATLAVTDTMASHVGWTEFVGYSEATRPLWAPATAASQAIQNSAGRTFTINASGTIHGSFCADENTKSGTTGTLWSTAPLPLAINVTNGDIINLTYVVGAA